MSVLLAVSVADGHLPSTDSVLEQLRTLGFVFAFPAGFDLWADVGYVPCEVNGQECGFEFSSELGSDADERRRVLRFDSRSSHADHAAASLVAGVITLLGKGSLAVEDEAPLVWQQMPRWLRDIELPGAEPEAELLRIPVTVIGPHGPSMLKLKLGRIPAGAHVMRKLIETIPAAQVPRGLQLPNSQFFILVRDAHEIVGVESA